MATKATITELEVLFTANTKPVDDAAKQVENRAKKIEKTPVEQKVDGNASGALAAMDRVEAEAKKIVSAKTMATVDANIERAETSLEKVQDRLDYLRSVESTMEVTADIAKAESAIKQITRRRDALVSAKESMVIDADTAPAEAALNGLADDAGEAGAAGGDAAGKGLGDGISDALKAIPIAGGIALVGVAIGKAVVDGFNEGLQVEVRQDRLQAMTGLSEEDAGRFARSAGEAYASNFGESIEANMDTARIAIQSGLLDTNATKRASQTMIESLSGVADVIGDEIPAVTRSTTQLLRTGLAKTADEAFDIIVKGQQAGLNVSEDWLDTINEYSTQWRKLGLDGGQTLGLLSQAVKAGARDTDQAADALKEFSIRAVDGSETTKAGFDAIGLSASDMAERIAAGGPTAAAALDETLDRLRAIEDPAARSAAAVGLFGTQAEDLGDALFAMDLSTAVDQLGQVEGAASRALATLGENTAGKIESMQRNIEVAADGIKGALASAFAPQIEGFAEFVTENRTAVIQFLLDAANGAIDFGRVLVEALAGGIEAAGEFVAGPLADMVEGFGEAMKAASWLLGSGDAGESLTDFADRMREVDETTSSTADTIRENLIKNTLDPAQAKLNEFGDGFLADARVHDATTSLANDIDNLGYAADQTTRLVDAFTVAQDGTITASSELDTQIRNVIAGFDAQIEAASAAGESQEDLRGRYDATRQALYDQLVQMGLTGEQAQALIDTYGLVPGRVDTLLSAQTTEAQAKSDQLKGTLDAIGFSRPSPYIDVTVDSEGVRELNQLRDTLASLPGFTQVGVGTVLRPGLGNADGNLLQFNARGNLNPMSGSVARIVPPNTWRVIGDRPYGDELFAPLDGSARSHALMAEGARRMGAAYLPLADGAVLGAQPVTSGRNGPLFTITVMGDMTEEAAGVLRDDLPWAIVKAGANR